MAAKLKSITKQIHWSLLLKAAVFGAAWLYLPFWVFLLVAFYCYFVPLFHAGRFAVLFVVLLILCAAHAPGILMAIVFAAIFYYLLLTKDLLLIDRASARSLLVMALSFLLFREFYFLFARGPVGSALFGAFFVAALFGVLIYNLIGNFRGSHDVSGDREKGIRNVASLLSFILIAQCLVIGLFLPLNFTYQSVLIFLVAALLIDFLPSHVVGTLKPEKIRLTSIVLFALGVVVLVSARWGF